MPEMAEPTPESPTASDQSGGESLRTVLIALAANAIIAVAKSVAAALTGSASMVAEAAHSWADSGNEIFLLVAQRRGARPRDEAHPRGHGRETYVWALFAAFGLFMAGAVVSVWHGIQALTTATTEPEHYTVNWIVLAVAFVLEGTSFAQALRQARGLAGRFGLHPMSFIFRTSNTTLRAVFLEDLAALGGLLLAGLGVGLHQLTGEAVWDAAGSIAVGLLLGVVAVVLINRNHAFLVGEAVPPEIWRETLRILLGYPQIERVTYLHLEYVGPLRFFVVAAVDLTGDDVESSLAVRLGRLESQIEEHETIEDAVLTLSLPDAASLTP
jgi:cation diffusion facilitator family transporter